MPGAAAWPPRCAGWFRASPAVSSGTSDRAALLKRFRLRAIWARSLRIIFHLAERLKLRAMHAKPPQDGTAPAVLWLEAIKIRRTGGLVAGESDDPKDQTAISCRSCRQHTADRAGQGCPRQARERRDYRGATQGSRGPRDRKDHQEAGRDRAEARD